MFESLSNLKVYEAGKPIELVVREFGIKPEDIVKLASNENPYGPSPKVIEKVKSSAHLMHRYPDDSFFELKEKLSMKFGIKSSNIIIGAGSDQVLEFIVRGVAPKKVLMAGITFAMYEIYSKQVGAKILKTEDIFHNLAQFRDIYKKEKPEIIFLCVPNNPLGECLDSEDIFEFLDEVDSDTLVVIDGAYQEFASFKDRKKEIKPKDILKYKNVIYTGTFSKAYGLGGMRVGYGIANEWIIQNLHKLRPPFNITTLSLLASIEALDDEEWVTKGVEENFKQMQRYIEFANRHNIKYIESYTNFIVLYIKNSSDVANKLLKKGVIVRDMSSYGFDAIRVTIGIKKENNKFFEVIEGIIS